MLAQPVAVALDLDDDGVVQQAIEERGCDDGIAEDLAPLGESAVGGEDHGAAFVAGVGYSAAITPPGRLLRRSGHAEDRLALFAAQFALSHACFLITYPLAGWLQAPMAASRRC